VGYLRGVLLGYKKRGAKRIQKTVNKEEGGDVQKDDASPKGLRRSGADKKEIKKNP
jgi:hypothetical protein